MRRVPSFDIPLLLCFFVLIGLGVTFIYTASYPRAMLMHDGGSFYFAGKQVIFAMLGLVAMLCCMYIPLAFFRRHAYTIGMVTAGLLILVLLIGKALHGNQAWIQIGPFQFQPSEFAKVAIIIVLAAYLAERPWAVRSWKGLFFGPYALVAVPILLIVLQKDLGTASVIALGSVVLLAIAGTKFRYWGIPLCGLLMLGALVVMTGHRAERFDAWQHPFNESIQASYQPRNSLIAVGSGGLMGRGFCMSRQKWFYLPGPHNDYIFAIVSEELGLVFTGLFLLAPYLFMVFRGFTVSHRAPDEFSALVAAGCTVMLATQALVNMSVVLNLIPCMGINLPFISYGGTSLIASMMMAGLLVNVSGQRAITKSRRRTQANVQPVNA